MTTQPDVTYTMDTHRYIYATAEIEILYERFHEDSRDGLLAEITVQTSRHPRPGLLYNGRLVLAGPNSRQSVVRALEKRRGDDFLSDVDFDGMLVQTAFMSLRRWRLGEPAIQLSEVQPSGQAKWLLYPYLQDKAICILFGDGGSGKSTLAEGMGLSVVTGRNVLGNAPLYTGNVLYLDWETEAESNYELLAALCRGLDMEVPSGFWYKRMNLSFPAGIAAVRQDVSAHNIKLVIIDSIGLAGGDEPERAGTKIALFNAARTLSDCTILAIDHVAQSNHRKPYGSVYTRNIARIAWGIDKAQEEGTDRLAVGLRLEKINRGKVVPRQGFNLEYISDQETLSEIRVEKMDPMTIDDFKHKAPLYRQLAHELGNGAKDIETLADLLEKPENTIKATLSNKRYRNLFQPLEQGLWGLASADLN